MEWDGEGSGQFEDDAAGDAIQRAITDERGEQNTIFNDEQVVPGALSHIALLVEHDRF